MAPAPAVPPAAVLVARVLVVPPAAMLVAPVSAVQVAPVLVVLFVSYTSNRATSCAHMQAP